MDDGRNCRSCPFPRFLKKPKKKILQNIIRQRHLTHLCTSSPHFMLFDAPSNTKVNRIEFGPRDSVLPYHVNLGCLKMIFATFGWILLLFQSLRVANADGSVAEGFIDEVVTDTKAVTGTFAPNPRQDNKPMMILNEKTGRVHVLENPDESPESIEILDLQSAVCTNGERGLQSTVPHPDFSDNRWIYAFYTKYREDCLEDPVQGPWNVVVRYTMDAETLELNVNEAVEIWRGMLVSFRLSRLLMAL
jgi:hypothetical protein